VGKVERGRKKTATNKKTPKKDLPATGRHKSDNPSSGVGVGGTREEEKRVKNGYRTK